MGDSFLKRVNEELEAAGLKDAVIVEASSDEHAFGDAYVKMELQNMVFAIVHDRGTDFVDVGSQSNTEKLYNYADLSVMMGWTSAEEAVKGPPPSLGICLRQIGRNIDTLTHSFSPANLMSTIAKMEGIANRRVKLMFG